MSEFSIVAQEIFEQCERLAEFSQSPNMMDRRYLTHEHQLANAQVSEWMKEAGMQTWQDPAGNQWGRLSCSTPNAPILMFGSHLDTVPNGGKYDGILGVITPIALVKHLHENNTELPFHIEIVGFGDEEGTRFGTTLIGSRAVSGNWDPNWAKLHCSEGLNMQEAMQNFGLDINEVSKASRKDDNLLAFVELHIEQGPVLEQNDLPVGIVSSIAGAKRFMLTVKGKAGHAGTVPMTMRQDSIVAFGLMVTAIKEIACRHNVVATVGRVNNYPNAVNVISETTEFSLDIRAEKDELRNRAINEIQSQLNKIAEQNQVSINWKQTHSASAVACDEKLKTMLSEAVTQSGISPLILLSGAGHDAMEIASICPMAMLFTRCKDGISHHPDESIIADDIAVSLEVLARFVKNLAAQD